MGQSSFIQDNLNDLYQDACKWCQGKSWQVRLPLALLLAYVWMQYFRDANYWSIFNYLNLGIHELGHYVFKPFGKFIEIAGGSILQCLVPLVGLVMFYRQRDYFALAFGLGWLATNFFGVATYVADARTMALPLVTPGGGEAIHDWNFLLTRLGLLRLDTTMAALLRLLAHLTMISCMSGMTWTMWKMYQSPGQTKKISRRL